MNSSDAVAGLQAGVAQPLRQARAARRPLRVRRPRTAAFEDRRPIGRDTGLALQQMGEGHGGAGGGRLDDSPAEVCFATIGAHCTRETCDDQGER